MPPTPPRVGERPGTENTRAMHGMVFDVPLASSDSQAVSKRMVTSCPSHCHAGDEGHLLLLRMGSTADSLPGTYVAGATHHAWGHLCSPLPSFVFCFDVPQVVSSLDAFLAIRALPLACARVHLPRSLPQLQL
jgi:hypothetical protein